MCSIRRATGRALHCKVDRVLSGLGDRLGNGPNRRKRDTVKQTVHTVPVDGVHAGVRRGAGSGESFFWRGCVSIPLGR